MKQRKKEGLRSRLFRGLQKSPIHYFSDLFMFSVVVIWLMVIVNMLAGAWVATVRNCDNSIWSDLGVLTAVPLSCGVAGWMARICINHHNANQQGKQAAMDLPDLEPFDTEGKEAEG